jgi:hypothetical protein
MGFDLHLAPPELFLQWSEEQWEAYWTRDPPAESEKLGNSTYVGLALDAVSHNLESERAGSRFPLLMRIDTGDPPGWHYDEVAQLLSELTAAKLGLASLPVNRRTLSSDSDEEVSRRITDYQARHAGRAPQNLLDLYGHFFDTFEFMANRAIETRQGMVASY